MNFADQLAVEWTEALLDLNSLTASAQAKALGSLRVLEADLVAQVQQLDIDGVARESWRRARVERMLRDTRKIIDSRYENVSTRMVSELRGVSTFAHDATVHVWNSVFTVDLVKPTLTREELRALADRNLVVGAPQAEWFEGQSATFQRRFAREMRIGIQQGETNEQLVRRLRGKRTGRTVNAVFNNGRTRRVAEFAGGIMDAPYRDVMAVVRTSTNSVANAAGYASFQGNEDVLRGYEAITTLDSRTSDICMARTGGAWDLAGDPLPESSIAEPFPGPPPWHMQCRSSIIPLTKSWEQLHEEATGQRRKLLETIPTKHRASMDGLIGTGAVRTFDDFLKLKGDVFARKKLGPGFFKLWKEGRLTTSQLIDRFGRPRTLTEVRESLGLAG